MSYKLVRSHRLYISSANRDTNDTPYQFRTEIPNGLITLDDPATQRMKISLLNFECSCNWFEINATNNQFIVTKLVTNTPQSVTIPEGNYTFQRLATTISRLYPDCVCRWIQETNMLHFTFTEAHSISFVNYSYEILGFDETDDGIIGLEITSTRPLKARANSVIYVRINDVILANDNVTLDNFTSIHTKPSNIFASVPINAPPFTTVFYDNSVYGRDVGILLSNPKLDILNISITDKNGYLLEYMTDWTMQLLVEIFDTEDDQMNNMISLLRSIDTTLRQTMLMRYLK